MDIKVWLKKYGIKTAKILWGIILLGISVFYLYTYSERIASEPSTIDYIVIVGAVILVFLPFISEISLMGFSIKKEIEANKQETKSALTELRGQLIDIRATAIQNTTQNLHLDFSPLPSSAIVHEVLNMPDEKTDNKDNKDLSIDSEFIATEDVTFLFQTRYALEKYVNKTLNHLGHTNLKSLYSKIDVLYRAELIDSQLQHNIKQVLSICNRGIHGEIISNEYILYVKKIIPHFYKELDKEITRLGYKHIITCPKCRFVGYSDHENVCPNCGYTTCDD